MALATLAEAQIQIRFVTKQEMYAVPNVPFSVSEIIDCIQLNKLLNQLLVEESEILKPVEFDFLVLGQLLRIPLKEHLQEFNVSLEETVEVEYVERTPAPEPADALLHDDWIGGIHVIGNWVLTGCYDHTVNIWTTRGKHFTSGSEHTNIVKAVSWLKQDDNSICGFVTVSHDLTGIIWQWEPNQEQPKPLIALRGHERGIDSVGVNQNSNRLATGSWDTYLKIWSASLNCDDLYEPSSKKVRGPKLKIASRTPLHTLKGHKENIVSVQWLEEQTICTASMDHTIKLWDTELCGLRNEIVAEKAFLGASWSPLAKTIITCSADRHIRLFDPRSNEGSVCKSLFTSHNLWVSAVSWSPNDEFLFMSGSFDQCVKLWDTRSPKTSLYDLYGHEGKVLCVDWTNPCHLVSGGTDNSVHIFKNRKLND